MARQRTGEKLLEKAFLPTTFFGWGLFLLQIIGRSTYRLIYYLLSIVFYLLKLFVQLIKLIGEVTFIIFQFIVELIHHSLFFIHHSLKRLKLPKLKTLRVFLSSKVNSLWVFLSSKVESLWVFLSSKVESLQVFLSVKAKKFVSQLKVKLPVIKISLPKLKFPKISPLKLPRLKPSKKVWGYSFCLSVLFFLLLTFYFSILKGLPNPNKLITRNQAVSTKIYDRKGRLLYTIYHDQNRSLIKLDELPKYLIQATVAIEDKDFYYHKGFSWRGIARAIRRNLFDHTIEGGSTITQQLVKNALLSSEKTYRRKIKEIILAVETEIIYSKDEILQMYLNEVPYGGTAYGIEEAAQTYFGKKAADLNLAEATLLAGLPAAPTKFSPFGANPQLAIVRQHQVLRRMVEDGYIPPKEAEEATQTKVYLAPLRTDIKAPHFVMYVKDLLVQKYDIRTVEQGGLKVTTSLDLDIQEMTQKEVSEEVLRLNPLHVTNGAALVTKPSTGEILAMVGSKDYFDSQNDGNVNVTLMPRQPGSAIKVVNYAMALSNGFTPTTILSDTPITYRIPGSEPYSPVNYDNRFHGNVTLRTALGSSYNVPAVKTLAVFGVNKMIDMGEKMGITTWQDRSRFGLSLTLGGGEVKMTDMAVVYGTLANLGMKVDLQPILKVEDYKGKVLEEYQPKDEWPPNDGKRAIDTNIAYLLTDILADNNARTPAFGPSSLLVIPNHQVAVKTGTTNDKKDNWTIGYTKDFLAAVWVGNNDSSPMSAVASGITGASPIWNHIISNLSKDQPTHVFKKPDEVKAVEVCSLNGLLPCEGCPTKIEYFLPGTEPTMHCSTEAMKKWQEEQERAKQDKILNGVSTSQ